MVSTPASRKGLPIGAAQLVLPMVLNKVAFELRLSSANETGPLIGDPPVLVRVIVW
jgi:hypothetical protein